MPSRRSFLHTLSMGIGAGFTSRLHASLPIISGFPEIPADKKLGIALVGLGSYAKNQLAVALEHTRNCYLAAICTGTPAKASEWSKKYQIPQTHIYNYDTFDRMADNKDIDIIYIVLPNGMHRDYVIRAAKTGKHVMCEKPMAISVTEAEDMITACRNAGVQLGIGYRMHFEPYTQEVMRLGQQKIFGQPRFIQTNFGFRIGDPKQWRLNKAMAGGGPLMDVGIYCVQAARYVTGEEPLSVTAQFGPVTDKERFYSVEESLSWQFTFPGNSTVNGFTSYKTNIEQLQVTADNGWFQLSPAYSYGPIKGSTSKGPMNFPVVHHQTAMLEGICDSLIQHNIIPAHTSGEEGLKDMRILMGIYDAARSGNSVPLV